MAERDSSPAPPSPPPPGAAQSPSLDDAVAALHLTTAAEGVAHQSASAATADVDKWPAVAVDLSGSVACDAAPEAAGDTAANGDDAEDLSEKAGAAEVADDDALGPAAPYRLYDPEPDYRRLRRYDDDDEDDKRRRLWHYRNVVQPSEGRYVGSGNSYYFDGPPNDPNQYQMWKDMPELFANGQYIGLGD